MANNTVKRYKYRNKITGVEFISSSICSGGAWELVKEITPRAAKQPEQARNAMSRKSITEVKTDNE